jgi:hypothetical protein
MAAQNISLIILTTKIAAENIERPTNRKSSEKD